MACASRTIPSHLNEEKERAGWGGRVAFVGCGLK